jgi:MFS family permease
MNTADSANAEPSPDSAAVLASGAADRRYMILYLLAALSFTAVLGGIGNVILPLHIQQIDFALFFTGALAQVNLQELIALKAKVDAGLVTATADQLNQLSVLAAFETAKASHLSVITSISVAATMIMQPVVGVWSDRTRSRMGRRAPWMVAGAVAAVIGVSWLQYADSVVQLTLAWSITSIACCIMGGPLSATVVDRMPPSKRGMMSAIAGLGLLFGYVLGMVVAGQLFSRMGLSSYWVFGAIAFVLPLAFVFGSRDNSSERLQFEPMALTQHLNSFTFALRDADFRWVWIARVIMLFGYAASGAFGIYMLQSYIQPGLSAEEAAKTAPLLHLVGMPFTVIAMVVSGRWSDKIGRRKPFVVGGSLLLALSFAVPFAWPSLTALYIQHLLAGIAVGTFLVVDQALLIDVLPDKAAAARDLGIGTLASNLGQAMGPLVASAVLAITGGYKMIWLVSMILVTLAAFAVLPVKRAK